MAALTVALATTACTAPTEGGAPGGPSMPSDWQRSELTVQGDVHGFIDVDGDGHLDLVTSVGADCRWTTFVRKGGPDGFGEPVAIGKPGDACRFPIAEDVDGDGRLDLLCFGSAFNFFRATDEGYAPPIGMSGSFSPVRAGGWTRVWSWDSYGARLFDIAGDGTLVLVRKQPVIVAEKTILQDVDGDGRTDILETNFTPYRVRYQQSDGAFGSEKILGPDGIKVQGVADIDGDGRPDVVTYLGDGLYGVWRCGTDGCDASSATALPSTTSVLLVDDVDGDGRGDLLLRGTRAFLGPIVVTDVVSSGDCPDELFVAAGDLERPGWFVVSRAKEPLNLRGLPFVVPPEWVVWVGVRGNAVPKVEAKCAVTWAGRKAVRDIEGWHPRSP